MQLMADVYNTWHNGGGISWESFVAAVERADLPSIDLGDGILVFAAEGAWKVGMHSREQIPWSPGLSDEDPKPVAYRYASLPIQVERHKVIEQLDDGRFLFKDRHFAEVPNGLICDCEESDDGFIVWFVDDDDRPEPVPFDVEAMRIYLARHRRERPDDLVGDRMWFDGANDRVAPHPLYTEAEDVGPK